MNVYKLKNACPYCGGTRFIHEEWVKNTIAYYFVGCNNEDCKGYHIDFAYNAKNVRLDFVVARYGGLCGDNRTKSDLKWLSNGLWSNGKPRIGKVSHCQFCNTSADTYHDDDCPVQIARELLEEINGQPAEKRNQN